MNQLGHHQHLLKLYEHDPDWKYPPLATKYPRCSTDRETAEKRNLEWVTPGHPFFEALRRHTSAKAVEAFAQGACYYSLQHETAARIDFYRARVVDGLSHIVHERLLALEIKEDRVVNLREPSILGNFTPIDPPETLPAVAAVPEATSWLNDNVLQPFIEETREERISEVDRIAEHVELSLTELLQRADEEIGKAAADVEQKVTGAEGRLARAENRHAELMTRRDRRRQELERQGSLSLQAVERITSVLVLPHPEREAPEIQRMKPNLETEAVAMNVVMEWEKAQGRQVYDVHENNLGYDVTSLDINSGELRLIEVKGLAAQTGTILLTPNEKRVAEDRRDCYWLYIVTNCSGEPQLQEPIKDPVKFDWHEVSKIAHYYLSVDAMIQPMQLREKLEPYEKNEL